MDTAAIQAEDRSKAHAGPLRVLHAAFHAFVITRDGLDDQLVRCAHLHHGWQQKREPSRMLAFIRESLCNATQTTGGGTKNSPTTVISSDS
jgi:hypothetical protein